MQALQHLDALVTALAVSETPATVVGTGPDGSPVEISEGRFCVQFVVLWT